MANRRICGVLVVDDLGWGGAERQVVELANNLDADRFDVHVCSLEDHTPLVAKCLRLAEHKVHIIAKKNRFDLTIILRLAYLLRTLQADIVHGYLFRADIVSRLAGCMAGTRLIIGSERNANRVISKRHILSFKLTHRCVDIIVANSNAGAESNARIFGRPSSDYLVVHNGVDTEQFRPLDGMGIRQELGIPIQFPVVGAFANFKKQKNHSMLLRAYRLVWDSFPDTRLLLVGDQPYETRDKSNSYKAQLDRLIEDLGIRHRCIFLGHRKDVEYLYPACDVTVLSSLHEGTPNVLLESMACCVPVIATNVCDNDYIVREGEVGHLVALGDYTRMACHIKSILGNHRLRQEMGQKARDWVLKEFSSKRLAKKMEAVYLELLSKKGLEISSM